MGRLIWVVLGLSPVKPSTRAVTNPREPARGRLLGLSAVHFSPPVLPMRNVVRCFRISLLLPARAPSTLAVPLSRTRAAGHAHGPCLARVRVPLAPTRFPPSSPREQSMRSALPIQGPSRRRRRPQQPYRLPLLAGHLSHCLHVGHRQTLDETTQH